MAISEKVLEKETLIMTRYLTVRITGFVVKNVLHRYHLHLKRYPNFILSINLKFSFY